MDVRDTKHFIGVRIKALIYLHLNFYFQLHLHLQCHLHSNPHLLLHPSLHLCIHLHLKTHKPTAERKGYKFHVSQC